MDTISKADFINDNYYWATVVVETRDDFLAFARVAEFEHWLSDAKAHHQAIPRNITWI